MTALMATVGILIIVVGIILSIALHEVGHLLPAKIFKVRVTQYMVGFGPTLWSKRRGETEYGVKAVPLGGYVAMIGMYPEPEQDEASALDSEGWPILDGADPQLPQVPQDPYLQQAGSVYGDPETPSPEFSEVAFGAGNRADGTSPDGTGSKTVASHSTGMFQQLSADAREVAAEQLQPGDEHRMFYRLATWKKIIIMLGGPAMNGLIALALTAGTITIHGTMEPTTEVAEVSECVITEQAQQDGQQECTADDPAAPAYEAGLLPGDVITEFRGQQVQTWDELTALIQTAPGESSSVTFERDGEQQSTTLTPILTERAVPDAMGSAQYDDDGALITEEVGFIGMYSQQQLQQRPAWEAGPMVWEQTQAVGRVVIALPQRLYEVAVSTFGEAERDPNGPLSVVGVGRIAGELSAQHEIPWESRFATLMSLVAGVNVALMVFNLIPLLPLDGGHVAGALWESLRRLWARLRRKPDPGPFDISKMLPLTYVVAVLMLAMGGLLIFADIVNPIRLFE